MSGASGGSGGSRTDKAVDRVRASPLFDAMWYRTAYPDVAASGMDPARHFVLIGDRLGRDPGPRFITQLWRDLSIAESNAADLALLDYLRAQKRGQTVYAPSHENVLLIAATLTAAGDHDGAVSVAERYLPANLAHAAEALRANAALARIGEGAWLGHLNGYLARWNLAPVRLEGEGPLLDRLTTGPLRAPAAGPLVSVLMPARNAEVTVEAAARSILRQTWQSLELIIVDDASTDGTYPVLQRIAASDARVRLICNPVGAGPHVARNIALGHTRGEWITGHDADDWAHPQRIERHMGATLAASQGLTASLSHMVHLETGGHVGPFRTVDPISPDGVARQAFTSCLFDANFLRTRLGHWDNVRLGAEGEMIGRAAALLGSRFAVLPELGTLGFGRPPDIASGAENGVGGTDDVSNICAAYKDSWTAWHKRLTPDSDAYLPFLQRNRRFAVSEAMRVAVAPESFALARPQAAPRAAETRGGRPSSRPMRVIIHVGMTKAGSTSIQNELDARREELSTQGILFPATGFKRLNPVDVSRTSGHLSLLRELEDGAKEELLAECAAQKEPVHTVLLSAENFMLDVPGSMLRRLGTLFAEQETIVLAVLRSPLAWCLSRYAESVTTGFHLEGRSSERFVQELVASGRLDYAARLDWLAKILGGAAVRALNYDALAAEDRLIEAVMAEIGFDAPVSEIRRDNVSYHTAEAIEAQRRLNPLAIGLPREARLAWGADLRERLGEVARVEGLRPGPPYLPERTRAMLLAEAHRTNLNLARHYLPGLEPADVPFRPAPSDGEAQPPDEDATIRLGRIALERLLLHRDAVQAERDPSPTRAADLKAQGALDLYDACAAARVILCLDVGPAVTIAAAMAGKLVLAVERASVARHLQARTNARSPAARVIATPHPSRYAEGAGILWESAWFRDPDLVVIGASDAELHLRSLRARVSEPLRTLIVGTDGNVFEIEPVLPAETEAERPG